MLTGSSFSLPRSRRPSDDTIVKYIQITIPKAALIHPPDSKTPYYVYFIKIKTPNEEWFIARRYSKFFQLYERLKPLCPPILSSRFPKQRIFFNVNGSKSLDVVEARRESLEWWLQGVLVFASKQEGSLLAMHYNDFNGNYRAAIEEDVEFLRKTDKDQWLLDVIGLDIMKSTGF
jgi:hypothetical protein